MNMLKMKWIVTTALVLGSVACKPLPVYPQSDGPSQPYPPRAPYQGDQTSPYGNAQYPRDPRPDPYAPYGQQQPPAVRPPVDTVSPRDQYPMAERTDNPNRVLSPYAPYNVIDVEGFRPGQLAKDPSNGKIFRIP